jgi:hypothetical protein
MEIGEPIKKWTVTPEREPIPQKEPVQAPVETPVEQPETVRVDK